MDAHNATQCPDPCQLVRVLTTPAAKANWRKLHFFFRQITPALTCSSVAQFSGGTMARRRSAFFFAAIVWPRQQCLNRRDKGYYYTIHPEISLRLAQTGRKCEFLEYIVYPTFLQLSRATGRGRYAVPKVAVGKVKQRVHGLEMAHHACTHVSVVLYRKHVCI